MKILASLILAAALPAWGTPGYFSKDAPDVAPAVPKASVSCSMVARYNPEHVAWQEQGWMGGWDACGGPGGYLAAVKVAAAGIPDWTSFGYNKVSVGDYTPPGPVYACSVSVNFEPPVPPTAAPTVQVVFTGAASCTAQRDRVLAVLRGGMSCYAVGGTCPWSNP